ncbi:MAG: T9SS type A sorting domain-containing protein [Bacteroidetes bacterium]|nr:T9SS type A sorting domain-containing protein [Bacteroidota bacterium]
MYSRNFLIKLFSIVIFSLFNFLAQGQYSYEVLFSSLSDERVEFVYHDKIDEEQVVLLTVDCDDDDTLCVERRYIYTITSEGDTIRWPFNDSRNDTMFSINTLVREENGDYFMAGTCWTQNHNFHINNRDESDYYVKWNSNQELQWEIVHPRPMSLDTFMRSRLFKILKLNNGNYLIGKNIHAVISMPYLKTYFVEIQANDGTVIKESLHGTGGAYLQSLTYNLDSSEILAHIGRTYMNECDRNSEGAIMLDTTNYEILGDYCYNRNDDDPNYYWCVNTPYNAKLSNDDKLILFGTGRCIRTNKGFIYHLFVYQYGLGFELLNRKFLTHADTLIDAGWYESLDINDNNEICVAGNHNRGVGPWNSQYSWIYLAKLDQDLELISERYLGGDAYYTIYSMAATSDGGIVTAGTRFDYLVNDFERDAFVIKTDGGLWVGQYENSVIPMHSAIVYPNPGNHEFTVRTTEYPSVVELYDTYGRMLHIEPINGLMTIINTSDLKNGLYTWILRKNNKTIDKGKWIKINQ